MKTCTKVYRDIPFAHRAPSHDGHCRLIHGHNWTFEITFAADEPDQCGFVVDFGKLKDLRAQLLAIFDHKLLINDGDPLLGEIRTFLSVFDINNVTPVADCSCEGIAEFVFKLANTFIRAETNQRAFVIRVTVFEDGSNSATHFQPR